MRPLFGFKDYKSFVLEWINEQPNAGRGHFSKIAAASGTHSSAISQVFRGAKHLTLEQAIGVSDYLGLRDAEAEYFLLLVQSSRAGTKRLRQSLDRSLERVRTRESQLSQRLPAGKRLAPELQGQFYSHWLYSAVRMLSFIPEGRSLDQIASRLRVPRATVIEVSRFLIENGLCIERDGKLHPGLRHTHLEASSPWVSRHHSNWRIKAMERHPALSDSDELAYSAPMTLSRDDASRLRELLAELIERARTIITPSPSEELYCLNIDWFKVI